MVVRFPVDFSHEVGQGKDLRLDTSKIDPKAAEGVCPRHMNK
jgi:hypothetical protein